MTSTCGNPQHRSGCDCGLNSQGTSRVYELEQALAATRLKLTSLEKEVREKLAALEKIVEIRNGAHPDGALGKLTDVWRVARAAIASGPCRAEALSHPTKTGTGGAKPLDWQEAGDAFTGAGDK